MLSNPSADGLSDGGSRKGLVPLETKWIAQPVGDRLQRDWDDEAVIYDPLSGSTHYLDSVAAAVLQRLRDESATSEAIAGSLCAEFEVDSEVDLLATLREALAKLQQMGLIRPADV